MAVRGRRGGPRARYKVRDWAAYDRSLVRRGDVTVWVSPDAIAGWRAPPGRRTFSEAAIVAALTVRAVYRLALRAAEGLIRSIFGLLGLALPMPDHTTLSRRGRTLRLEQRVHAGRGFDLAIDSTGLRLAKPIGAGHEGWRKLHITVDPDMGQILVEELRARTCTTPCRCLRCWSGSAAGSGVMYGDVAYAGGPTYRAVTEHRQFLPNAEGVFKPKAPDVRAACCRRGSPRMGAGNLPWPAQCGGVDPLTMDARARGRTAVA